MVYKSDEKQLEEVTEELAVLGAAIPDFGRVQDAIKRYVDLKIDIAIQDLRDRMDKRGQYDPDY